MNTLVALPIAGALPVAMAIPDASTAPADPIFSLIKDYRTAAKTAAAAASEVSRREDILIERGSARARSFPCSMQADRAARGQPWFTSTSISTACFRLTVSANQTRRPMLLDAQIERHKAIVGDSEDVLNAALDARWTPSSGRDQRQ
jgi:hypothetical protein